MDWHAFAACAAAVRAGTADIDDWFPSRGDGRNYYARARAICAGCPVRAECLADALAYEQHTRSGEVAGMFGALSPQQRVQLRRERRDRTVA
jgi:WhiB family redox-sensing transcriptional regulator